MSGIERNSLDSIRSFDLESQTSPDVRERLDSHGSPRRRQTSSEALKGLAPFEPALRGYVARQKVSVSPVANTGITQVSIAGNSDDLNKLGFKNIDTSSGPRSIKYLSVPLDKYSPHLAGGQRVYEPVTAPSLALKASVLSKDAYDNDGKPVAYINGSYYNFE